MTRDVVTRFKAEKPKVKKRERLNERCEVRVDGCWGRASHRHHIQRRSQGGTDESHNLLACCGSCHHWVHHNIAASKVAGWLA